MKIKYFDEVKVEKEIDIEFPYYFKHDLYLDESDTVIYGRIMEKSIVKLALTQYPKIEVDIETNSFKSSFDGYDCYFKDKYKSTEGIFQGALEKAKEILEKI